MIGSVSLTTIARVTGGKLVGSDVVFDSVSTDSRTIQPGELFIALSGPSYEGDRFVAGAHASGAIAAVVRRLQEVALSQVQVEDTQLALVQVAQMNRRAFEGTVVAITGSSGKTTVKELVAHLLAGQGETLATKGNLNNLIGVPMTLTRIDASHRFAVIELGASALGEIAQTAAWTQPDIAVITNAGNAHLGGFGSLENIVRAKGEIIDSLAADGVAVLNADDLAFPLWKTRAKARKVVSFSASGVISADVYAKDIRLGDGAEFLLCSGDENYLVQLPLQGKQNVANALAASAVALECGMSLSVIARRLATAPRVKGRLESVMFSSGMRLINDSYNANPASVKAAMDVIAPLPGHRIAVLGDMAELGADAVALHREVGAYAKALRLDELYLTGNYANDVAQGFGAGAQCFPDKASLISAIKKVSQANLTLLVKGSRSAAMEDVVNELTQTNKVVQSC
ncbi:MAG: UDP-N-acetylmuramoyl-tripeptide--D-alanyl-D-alanine ligase [Hahellaceae bacterium]|nr:UDP-N-acetylmuramoyl-tripeptide--D-alanyl-D-alanine ligase [Hahellaceae bacterium]MCP5169851.1 UDP-N-acetylmuramoyl-tripeptide--D-alanyl-D-alanine ligase [Hahellaceae bacterium]